MPPEVNSVPAAEWIPGSDPAQNQATAQGERLGQCEPSSSTDPKQLDGDAALANPSVGAAQEEPVSGDEQAAGQPGEVSGGKRKPIAEDPAKAISEKPAESVSVSATDDDSAQAAAGQPTGQESGQAAAAASVTQTQEASQPQRAVARGGGHRQVGKAAAADAEAETLSESLDQPLNADGQRPQVDVAAPVLSPELAAPPKDQKTEAADGTPKTVAPEVGRSEAAPPIRSPAVAESAAGSSGDAETTPAADQLDRVRFVQRVSRAFEAVGDRGGSIRLRLHPPELGSLRLELTVRNGVMNARVEAETPAARNLLLDHLPALRDRLAEQQIKVERFDVDLMDHSAGGAWQQPPDQSPPRAQQAEGGSRRRGQRETAVADADAARTPPRYGDGNGFDVTI